MGDSEAQVGREGEPGAGSAAGGGEGLAGEGGPDGGRRRGYLVRALRVLTKRRGWPLRLFALLLAGLVPVVGPVAVLAYALERARLTALGDDGGARVSPGRAARGLLRTGFWGAALLALVALASLVFFRALDEPGDAKELLATLGFLSCGTLFVAPIFFVWCCGAVMVYEGMLCGTLSDGSVTALSPSSGKLPSRGPVVGIALIFHCIGDLACFFVGRYALVEWINDQILPFARSATSIASESVWRPALATLLPAVPTYTLLLVELHAILSLLFVPATLVTFTALGLWARQCVWASAEGGGYEAR